MQICILKLWFSAKRFFLLNLQVQLRYNTDGRTCARAIVFNSDCNNVSSMDSLRKWISTRHPLFLFFLVITGGYVLWVGAMFLNSLRPPRVESNSRKKPQLNEKKEVRNEPRRFTSDLTVEKKPHPTVQANGKEPLAFDPASTATISPLPNASTPKFASTQPATQSQQQQQPQSQPDVVVTEADDNGAPDDGVFRFKAVPAIVNDKDVTITAGMWSLSVPNAFLIRCRSIAWKVYALYFLSAKSSEES
jgi:hypothetical protein